MAATAQAVSGPRLHASEQRTDEQDQHHGVGIEVASGKRLPAAAGRERRCGERDDEGGERGPEHRREPPEPLARIAATTPTSAVAARARTVATSDEIRPGCVSIPVTPATVETRPSLRKRGISDSPCSGEAPGTGSRSNTNHAANASVGTRKTHNLDARSGAGRIRIMTAAAAANASPSGCERSATASRTQAATSPRRSLRSRSRSIPSPAANAIWLGNAKRSGDDLGTDAEEEQQDRARERAEGCPRGGGSARRAGLRPGAAAPAQAAGREGS